MIIRNHACLFSVCVFLVPSCIGCLSRRAVAVVERSVLIDSLPKDGSTVFMDFAGGIYKLNLTTGATDDGIRSQTFSIDGPNFMNVGDDSVWSSVWYHVPGIGDLSNLVATKRKDQVPSCGRPCQSVADSLSAMAVLDWVTKWCLGACDGLVQLVLTVQICSTPCKGRNKLLFKLFETTGPIL